MSKRRSLGQHFLISNSVAEKIVDSAKITKEDIVLEVGTGKGILTRLLCQKAKQVISVEKDAKLYLEAKHFFSDIPNLTLVQGDAFELDFSFTTFVSNLPYSESRNAIEWLVQRKFRNGTIMVQKEFAEKLLAKKGVKDRRAISVIAGYCFDIQTILQVKSTNFRPVPKVDSVVISLVQNNMIPKKIIANVNKLFSFKRKTLGSIGKKIGIEIDNNKRVDEIDDSEVMKIARRIKK